MLLNIYSDNKMIVILLKFQIWNIFWFIFLESIKQYNWEYFFFFEKRFEVIIL